MPYLPYVKPFKLFTETELESRCEIQFETYAKTINIEAKAMIDIAGKQIIPAVIRATTCLAKSINEVTQAGGGDVSVQKELLDETSDLLSDTKMALSKLIEVDELAGKIEDAREMAEYYHDTVMPAMDALRAPVDKLEMIVDKDLWPMPSYGDLIFEV